MQNLSYERLLKACMWVAVAIGAYARLVGLGTWPLTVDEFYIVQSVENILRNGLPAYDCGGYYMRAITMQYLVVPLYWLGIHAELAARLVPVAFSFALLVAVYYLGKRLSGVAVACVSVALLSISLWEIEFARFARMYVPFQFIFVCYVLALHRAVVDRNSAAHGWLWLLSAIGVFTWAGGLFLLVVNFVPSAIERTPSRTRHLAVSGALLVLGYLYSTVNFRFMGGQPLFPPDVAVELGGGPIITPPLLVTTLSVYPAWMAAALAVLLVCLAALVIVARTPVTVRERVAWAGLIGLSLFNLFGCVLIGLTLALLLGWIDWRRASRRNMRVAGSAIGVSFVFWLAYALLTDTWYRMFPGFGAGGDLSKLAVVLFKYPNIFDPILFPWLGVIPALTAALFGLAALAGAWAIWATDDERLSSLRLTLAVCLIMTAMIAVVETKYIRTRYSFFLLPLLYPIAVTAIHGFIVRLIRSRPARGMAFGLSILAMVGLTEDFGWAHMTHIDRAEWNFRLNYSPAVSEHYYPRWDVRSTAEFVNRRARRNDVTITTDLPTAYYLERTDYVYMSSQSAEFAAISCDAGRRERWTGSGLFYRVEDVLDAIDRAKGSVWIIVRLPWYEKLQSAIKARYSAKVIYRGRAGIIGVYKIDRSQ